jgi:hypothetical protein
MEKEFFKLPKAKKGREFVYPIFQKRVRAFVQLAGPLYLKKIEGVRSVKIENSSLLLEQFKAFYSNKRALIFAFRHAAKEDAPVLMHALNTALKKEIKTLNKQLPKKEKIIGHAHFVYGSDVLNWAPAIATYVFPRIGAIPVQNRKTDRIALNLLKDTVQNGEFPLALAPESQVTYHMYRPSEMSAGVASLVEWALEAKDEVVILPLSVAYSHSDDKEAFIKENLKKWEELSGFNLTKAEASLVALLKEATLKTIEFLEDFYKVENEDESIKGRIFNICDKALKEAESITHIKKEGSLLDRLFRLRFKGVDTIYPQNIDFSKLSLAQRSLLNFEALKAHLFLVHTQLVDVLQYIDITYIEPPVSMGRLCEYSLNLLDIFNRLDFGNIDSRFSPKNKDSFVFVGEPLLFVKNFSSKRKERLEIVKNQVYKSLEETSLNSEKKIESSYLFD